VVELSAKTGTSIDRSPYLPTPWLVGVPIMGGNEPRG
jgi:hypothetical protein